MILLHIFLGVMQFFRINESDNNNENASEEQTPELQTKRKHVEITRFDALAH